MGLKTCFPFQRMRNLLAMVMPAAPTATARKLVRSSRHNDRLEMRALLGSKRGSPESLVHTY